MAFYIVLGVMYLTALALAVILTARFRGVHGARGWFVIALCVGLLIRLALSSLGHNNDMDAWTIVGDQMVSGLGPYHLSPTGEDTCVKGGPVWPYILYYVRSLSLRLPSPHPESYHMLVSGVLAVVDSLIAVLLAVMYGYVAAALFLVLPVSFLITAFHAQTDNLAVLLGLISWRLLYPPEGSCRRPFVSAFVLGLSLATKHILLLFPVWLFFARHSLRDWRERSLFLILPPVVFLFSFLPWIANPVWRANILDVTFGYTSNYGWALLPYILKLLAPLHAWESLFSWVPVFRGLLFVWLIFMLSLGLGLSRWDDKRFILYYISGMVALAPAMADQYLAIPATACAVFRKNPFSWLYIAVASITIIGGDYNIGTLPSLSGVREGIQAITALNRWHTSQLCLVGLLVWEIWVHKREGKGSVVKPEVGGMANA